MLLYRVSYMSPSEEMVKSGYFFTWSFWEKLLKGEIWILMHKFCGMTDEVETSLQKALGFV